MTAVNVKNLSDAPLTVRGATITPGSTARIEDWQFVENDDMVRFWIAAGALEVTEGDPRSAKETGPTEEEIVEAQIKAERKSVREDAKVGRAVRGE